MKRLLSVFLLTILALGATVSSQPVISERQDVAIFALGYYGWNIPFQSLGSIDGEIQKVFADLGRFNILGVSQRLSSGGLEQFISIIKQAKQSNFVMPEKYQFGEAFLTEAEFNRLVGAFIVVAPVVTEFNSYWDSRNQQYKTTLKVNITFIDVSGGGTVTAIKEVSTSGYHSSNQYESIRSAIESIPSLLQFEVRSIPQFQLNTRILAVQGGQVKLQMGSDMGIMKGDEYSVIQAGSIEGFDDSREVGLIVIKEVSREVSTGQVVYSSIKLGKDTQLREIPRIGTEADLYIHNLGDDTIAVGLRATATRGFFAIRPYVAVQIPLELISSFLTVEIFPVNALFGAEYNLNMGRLSVAPHAAIGLSYFHVTSPWVSTDTEILSHVGAQIGARVSYLFNTNMKAFVDIGFEEWLAIYTSLGNESYGGSMIGLGATYKL